MALAHGKCRLKWTPDWPVTLAGSPAAKGNMRARKGGRTVHIAVCCAFMVALVVAGFHHSAFGF
jgi:hypothetical protein